VKLRSGGKKPLAGLDCRVSSRCFAVAIAVVAGIDQEQQQQQSMALL